MTPATKACFFLFIFISSLSRGQMTQYTYKRELKGISGQWHKIVLPDEIFGKASQDLSDIRIFGLTKNNDTIEAPYLLQLTTDKVSKKVVLFKIVNTSRSASGYYFIFEVPHTETLNNIKLDFKNENFDWRTRVDGSQNLQEWFTIIGNYRILSIKNKSTDFQFTDLTFPDSKYRYYRLLIAGNENPQLNAATISREDVAKGLSKKFAIKKSSVRENKQTKQTEIEIELELSVAINEIDLGVSDRFDYYRQITIEGISDSLKTEQGWKYNYRTLVSGTINSIQENKFRFPSTIVQRLRMRINNQDNQPLTIDTIHVRGAIHEMLARFTQQADYFLTYGNKNAQVPKYDIERFAEKIPATLDTLQLGNETMIAKQTITASEPLFKSKMWLWAVMGVIILLLGWCSIRMIDRSSNRS